MKNETQSKLWMKNSSGEQSATVTLMWVAFIVTTISYILSMFEEIAGIRLRPFDVGAASTYFIPILTLYGGRRWTQARYSVENGGLRQEYTPREDQTQLND